MGKETRMRIVRLEPIEENFVCCVRCGLVEGRNEQHDQKLCKSCNVCLFCKKDHTECITNVNFSAVAFESIAENGLNLLVLRLAFPIGFNPSQEELRSLLDRIYGLSVVWHDEQKGERDFTRRNDHV